MHIFIELPTWLGDAVMASPAIEIIIQRYPKASITWFGSYVALEAFKKHPKTKATLLDEGKKASFRPYYLYRQAQTLHHIDLAFSFRSSTSSSLLLWLLKTKHTFQYKKNVYSGHQVEKYAKFITEALHVNDKPQALTLHHPTASFERPMLGINPGATYGSAKRWYPEEFAKVAAAFSNDYDILIFGGPNETDMAQEVENALQALHVNNFTNLAGKTTIPELISSIAGLSLFITNDSGPMHVAAAYGIPTVALFGPTKHKETCQWKNKKSVIVRHELSCAPCMKRTCPLKTHECMKSIQAAEVIEMITHHRLLDK